MAITISGSGITSANIADGTIVNADVNSSAAIDGSKISGSFGKVLQVVSTTVTDRNSTTNTDTSGVGTDVGLNVTLTAQSSTSRYLIMLDCGLVGTTSDSVAMILSKGGSKIGNGVDSGSRNGVWCRAAKLGVDHGFSMSGSYFDTTSTTAGSSVTYKSGFVTQAGTGYINRSNNDTNTSLAYGSNTQSTITVMEIEA